jgi:hypothetical protein
MMMLPEPTVDLFVEGETSATGAKVLYMFVLGVLYCAYSEPV